MTQHRQEVRSTEPDRGTLAKMVLQLFERWNLSTEQQLALLGLEERSALARYRKGEPLAQNRDMLDRVGHLLAIHKNLRLLFPHNRDLAYSWMSMRNKAFGGRAPTEVISEIGFAGLLMVRSYLDRIRGGDEPVPAQSEEIGDCAPRRSTSSLGRRPT